MRKMLEKLLRKLIPFVADSTEYRSVLKGICIKKNEVIVSDGFILVRKELEDKTGDELETIIVPCDKFKEAMDLLSKNKVMTSLVMETDNDNVSFNLLNGIEIKTKVIEGEYPDIEHVYPIEGVEPEAEIEVNSKLLEKVCKLAYIDGDYNRLKLKIYKTAIVFETTMGFSGVLMLLRKAAKDFSK